MTTGNKPTSRFLPTLTEVVQPVKAARVEASANSRDDLATSIALIVQQNLESVLQEMVHRVMREEAARAKEGLMHELEPLIRGLVAEALERSLPPAIAE